jgi:uncharacterized Zn finger protein (UPF0148 family)
MNQAPLQKNCFECGRSFLYQPVDGAVVIHPKRCPLCEQEEEEEKEED